MTTTLAVAALALTAAACDPAGGLVTYAGTGVAGSNGDGGSALAAQLNRPGDTVAIPGGGYYVLDGGSCTVRKVDVAGTITTVAGQAGVCGYLGDDGPATEALIKPYLDFWGTGTGAGLLALGGDGDLFIADSANSRIRKVDPSGTISTVADTGLARIYLATDPAGNVYFNAATQIVGDPYSGIYAIQADDSIVDVLPDTTGTPDYGLAVDGNGDLYFVGVSVSPRGSFNTVIRHTVAGNESTGISGTAVLVDVAVAADGGVYAATQSGVLHVPAGGSVVTIAGNGSPDPGTGVQPSGDPLAAALSPNGIELTPAGGIMISSGHAVYRMPQP